jgi:hypothetical protein
MRKFQTPYYLSNLIPPRIQSTTIYLLRNGDDKIVRFFVDNLLLDTRVSLLRLKCGIV